MLGIKPGATTKEITAAYRVMANDAQFPQSCKALEDIGLKKVFDPDKIVVVIDHWVPANTPMVAEMHRGIRAQVKAAVDTLELFTRSSAPR